MLYTINQNLVINLVEWIYQSSEKIIIMVFVRTEIGLVPKQDWAQTQAAQTINLQSVDRRTRSIPEERRLNLIV